MCKVQMLRALVEQRLTAAAEEIFGLFERTIAEYEEELCRSKEENERQRELLDAVFNPQLRVHRAALPSHYKKQNAVKEEQQECSSNVDQQDPEPPTHIKKEQEELTTFTPVPVKSEDDEGKAESSLLHQTQTQHMETAADGEDCGGPEPSRNSQETREPQSAVNSLEHDSTCKKRFSCFECGRRFGRMTHLKSHMITHTGEKPFSCPFCWKHISRRGNLNKHMRIHTGEKPFSCSVCKKSFTHQESLPRHMRMHTGEEPFSCSECGKRFFNNSHLKKHMESHTGREPALSCSVFIPRFGRKTHLKSHMKTYTREKAFSSLVCKKSFPQDVHLCSNMKIHTREKRQFSCSFCERDFKTSGSLEKHMRIHTRKRHVYTCFVCDKPFIYRGSLDKHMRVHKGHEQSTSCVSDLKKQRECSSSVDQQMPKPPPNIKEEQEDLFVSQEGEQLQGLEEADITKFPFTPVPVKSEDNEEEAQSSQLHQRQTQHMERQLSNSCDAASQYIKEETEVLDNDWKETREPQSALHSLNIAEVPVSRTTDTPGKKLLLGSKFWKGFGCKAFLKTNTITEKILFSCSVCGQSFTWYKQLRNHQCVGRQSQTEENREETEDREREADGEDCGGPEPARNLHTVLQPETEDQTGDSAEPETDDSADWKETREPQSALKSLKNEDVPVSDEKSSAGEKSFICSECGKRFGTQAYLRIHIRIHTLEKPFSCSVCKKSFSQKGNLQKHMVSHTGKKKHSCSVCGQKFMYKEHVNSHMKTHTGGTSFNYSFTDRHKPLRRLTGEKTFSCSVCGDIFSNRSHLSQHMAVHTREKRFSCSVCEERFTLQSEIKTHKCAGCQSSQLH